MQTRPLQSEDPPMYILVFLSAFARQSRSQELVGASVPMKQGLPSWRKAFAMALGLHIA